MPILTSYNYFASRTEAGSVLANFTQKYRAEDTIVLALSHGGVLVGAEIAKNINSLIAMLLTRDIFLPDGRTLVGVINELGGFIHNNAFSTGIIEDFEQEYRNYLDFAKMQAVHEMHMAIAGGGEIRRDFFRNRIVIAVSDGALNGTSFDMVSDFLRPVHYKKLVLVTPFASVEAVDKMHILGDELICLSVKNMPFDTNHYYEDNNLPDENNTLSIINEVLTNWQNQHKLVNS